MTATSPTGKETIAARLQRLASELVELEQAIRNAEVDPRVLQEFREAVDHIRQTTWAVKQWQELHSQQRDAYSVLSVLIRERVRRTTQLARDLALDLDAAEITFETEGIASLRQGVEQLFQRLSRIVK